MCLFGLVLEMCPSLFDVPSFCANDALKAMLQALADEAHKYGLHGTPGGVYVGFHGFNIWRGLLAGYARHMVPDRVVQWHAVLR